MRAELNDLRGRLARPRASCETQCDAPTPRAVSLQSSMQTEATEPARATQACQVDTRLKCDGYGDNMQSVVFSLEQKCHELDTSRADLDRLASVHNEALTFLDTTKQRLAEEVQRRKAIEGDAERLGIQARALQQQCAQLLAQLREKDAAAAAAQQRMQLAVNAQARVEEERRAWEADMATHARDMQALVAHQTLVTGQLEEVSQENSALRGEVQALLQREAQGAYSLKAKDVELAEILAAYQAATRESEGRSTASKALEREADNLRAHAAAKEQRVAALAEQVRQLHAREQQLAVDLQSCDYEGGLLHRKLVAAEQQNAQWQAQAADLQQQVAAAQRVTFEFERHTAELQKQLVIRDSESLFLRNRCDGLEHELAAIRTQHGVERQRLQELEDSNARLVVRSIIAQSGGGGGAAASLSTAGPSSPQYQHPTTGVVGAALSQSLATVDVSAHHQQHQHHQQQQLAHGQSPQSHLGTPIPHRGGSTGDSPIRPQSATGHQRSHQQQQPHQQHLSSPFPAPPTTAAVATERGGEDGDREALHLRATLQGTTSALRVANEALEREQATVAALTEQLERARGGEGSASRQRR